jgi:hypothetical protein
LEELEELEENRIRCSDYYLFFLPVVFQWLEDNWKNEVRHEHGSERQTGFCFTHCLLSVRRATGVACLLEELEELEENDVIGCYHELFFLPVSFQSPSSGWKNMEERGVS